MHENGERHRDTRQLLEHMIIPLHYATIIGLHHLTAVIGTGALLLYVAIIARTYSHNTGAEHA